MQEHLMKDVLDLCGAVEWLVMIESLAVTLSSTLG